MAVSALPDGSWWVDDPIGEPGEDLFGRGQFVARAVALLDQIGSRPSSTVVGLVGPWVPARPARSGSSWMSRPIL
jgi:hypothetical protein